MNRVLPDGVTDSFFSEWKTKQREYVDRAEEFFNPVPIFEANLFRDEVVGEPALRRLADSIYGDEDPNRIFYREMPYEISKRNNTYRISIKLPFIVKQDVELVKGVDELIVRIGSFKRHILLPRQVAASLETRARFEGDHLIITLEGDDHAQQE